jgi:hypothetical protein
MFTLVPAQSASPPQASEGSWQAKAVEKHPGSLAYEAQSSEGPQSAFVVHVEGTQRPAGSSHRHTRPASQSLSSTQPATQACA